MQKLKRLRETLKTTFFSSSFFSPHFLPKLTWSYGLLLIYASVFDVAINWMCHWPWLDDRGNCFPRMNCSWTVLYYKAGLWFLLTISHASIHSSVLFILIKQVNLITKEHAKNLFYFQLAGFQSTDYLPMFSWKRPLWTLMRIIGYWTLPKITSNS